MLQNNSVLRMAEYQTGGQAGLEADRTAQSQGIQDIRKTDNCARLETDRRFFRIADRLSSHDSRKTDMEAEWKT
jgi:hypothetical protein